jgi:hypothetical protein
MDLRHAQFQSLSACEAQDVLRTIDRHVADKMVEAYKAGYRDCGLFAIMCNMEPLEMIEYMVHSMNKIGIEFTTIESAAGVLADVLATAVRTEERYLKSIGERD